jgi:hypothetical protein
MWSQRDRADEIKLIKPQRPVYERRPFVIIDITVGPMPMIVDMIVKPPIDESDSHPKARSATTHIHNRTAHLLL